MYPKRLKKKKLNNKKRKRIKEPVDPTPNLTKLEEFAGERRRDYPKLTKSLEELRRFVGATEIKETIAKSAQYVISHQTASQPKRRSARKRRKPSKLLVGRNTLRQQRRPRLDTDELSEEEEEDYDPNSAFPEDMPESFKAASFGALLALAMSQHGYEESDSEEEEDEDEDEQMQLRYKKPEYMKGIMQHTMLLGRPGTGKTTLANVLVDIWDSLGVVDKKRYFSTSRGDWVGKYQGHSVAKARKLIQKARGGVIFIDEAYSLIAAKDGDDTYGHEVLTEITEAMTSPEKNVTFIFAGYEGDMARIFGANKGLRRRFGYIYKLKKPDPVHLFLIFQKQLKESKWKIPKRERLEAVAFFQKYSAIFEWGGGSTGSFIQHAKESAISRHFPFPHERKLLVEDLKTAHVAMVNHNQSTDPIPAHIKNMYL
jgi:SpoVK/Ycf46/Vps4 family AAA+-type ATPase